MAPSCVGAFAVEKHSRYDRDMIVCVCRRVSDRDIERAMRAGAGSFEEIQLETGAATCCGRCSDCARAIVERVAPSIGGMMGGCVEAACCGAA